MLSQIESTNQTDDKQEKKAISNSIGRQRKCRKRYVNQIKMLKYSGGLVVYVSNGSN